MRQSNGEVIEAGEDHGGGRQRCGGAAAVADWWLSAGQ